MTTRVLTKHQFSQFTTIDGNRIEVAMSDIQERFNSPEFRDIDMWKENTFHYGFSPIVRAGLSKMAPWEQGSPFAYAPQSNMYPSIPNYEGPNNAFRLKGAGLVNPITGIPIFARSDNVPQDLSFFWTATQYFTQPSIIQDFTIFGLYDDRSDATALTGPNKWYGNEWVRLSGPPLEIDFWENKWVIWVVIDNPQNTGDTFIRNSEVHQWATSAEGLTMNPNWYLGGSPMTPYTDETLLYNPLLPSAQVQKINGNAVRFHNLNIPVFSGARVRFIIGLPSVIAYDADENIYPGNATTDSTYYPVNNNETTWSTDRIVTYQNNLWNLSIHVLEPVEVTNNG